MLKFIFFAKRLENALKMVNFRKISLKRLDTHFLLDGDFFYLNGRRICLKKQKG